MDGWKTRCTIQTSGGRSGVPREEVAFGALCWSPRQSSGVCGHRLFRVPALSNVNCVNVVGSVVGKETLRLMGAHVWCACIHRLLPAP